jgi:putative transposase
MTSRGSNMANTFSQIYIQTVFAVSNRQSLIKSNFKEDPYKYITGIVKNQGQKLISINGMPDHVHILIGLRPAMALADLVQEIKADSSNFVNKREFVRGRFSWQATERSPTSFPVGYDRPLHPESGETSPATIVQR